MSNFIDLSDLDYKPKEKIKKETPDIIYKKVIKELKKNIKIKKNLQKIENKTNRMKKKINNDINSIFNINLYSDYNKINYKIKFTNILSEFKNKYKCNYNESNEDLYLINNINEIKNYYKIKIYIEPNINGLKRIGEIINSKIKLLNLDINYYKNYCNRNTNITNYVILNNNIQKVDNFDNYYIKTTLDNKIIEYDSNLLEYLNYKQSDNLLLDIIKYYNFTNENNLIIPTFENLKKLCYENNYGIIEYDYDTYNIKNKIINKYSEYSIHIITQKDNIYLINNISYFYSKIEENKLRDQEKNNNFILLKELKKYPNYYISYRKNRYHKFKYSYILERFYYKQIKNLLDDDYDILFKLVNFYGIYFTLFDEYLEIPKELFKKENYNDNYFICDYDNKLYYYIDDNYKIYYGKSHEEIELLVNKKVDIIYNHIIDLPISKINYDNLDNIIKIKNYKTHKILGIELINVENNITFKQLIELYEKSKKECILCKKQLLKCGENKFSMDAKNPLKGHVYENISIDICRLCNCLKSISYIYDDYSIEII